MVQVFSNILIAVSVYTIVSISFSVIYQTTKFFHLAHAAIIVFGAYFTYLFSQQMQMALWLSIPLAIILATVMGLLIEIALYKPLRKRKAIPLVFLITSLGLYIILQNIISLIWGDDTKSIRTGPVEVGNEFFGAYITDIQIITIVVSIILFAATLLFIKYTTVGKNMRAVSSNEELSNIFGINSDAVILWSFGIGSALAAIAGILVALDTDMTPTMGFNLLLYGIVAMIIGGVGSITGLIGGAFLLATAQHLGAYYIDSKWMDAIAYIILILFLIWKPLGFSGRRLKKVEI